MADSESTPWIRLYFVVDDYVLRVGYGDSRGNVVRPSHSSRYHVELPRYILQEHGAETALTETGTWAVLWPQRASAHVFSLVQHGPAFREGPHGGGSVPLAVLVASPPGSQSGSAFDSLASAILHMIGLSSQKYVVGLEVPGPAAPPFDVPFDIADTTSAAGKLGRFVRRLLGNLGAASTLPVAGVTALQSLRRLGNVMGRRVLVTGASGGVGRFAVQLAARSGANVIASVGSPARGAELSDIGASEVAVGLHEVTGRLFGVLDMVGGPQLANVLGMLDEGGRSNGSGAPRVHR